MPVMPDHWIREMAETFKMIEPFAPEQVKTGVSFGLSSYGYDFRINDEFKIFDPECVSSHMMRQPEAGPPLAEKQGSSESNMVLDPKDFAHVHFRDYKGDVCDIPPNGYVLGKTVEYFRIPRDIITICYGKSTYARCGVSVNVTPFEPEWEGYATIAISNTTPRPVRIYANEGIGQLLFLKADTECSVSYADKKGKYQAQKEITVAKI